MDNGDERPRKRAKLACTNCNARRVKCDVTDRQPCRNCEVSQAVCETRESKRGKHPRKPKGENNSNAEKRNSVGAAALVYVLETDVSRLRADHIQREDRYNP